VAAGGERGRDAGDLADPRGAATRGCGGLPDDDDEHGLSVGGGQISRAHGGHRVFSDRLVAVFGAGLAPDQTGSGDSHGRRALAGAHAAGGEARRAGAVRQCAAVGPEFSADEVARPRGTADGGRDHAAVALLGAGRDAVSRTRCAGRENHADGQYQTRRADSAVGGGGARAVAKRTRACPTGSCCSGRRPGRARKRRCSARCG
jgi:hypothetical protein